MPLNLIPPLLICPTNQERAFSPNLCPAIGWWITEWFWLMREIYTELNDPNKNVKVPGLCTTAVLVTLVKLTKNYFLVLSINFDEIDEHTKKVKLE